MSFTDGLGRAVNYLRLSVTDRCNLRCAYCSRREQTEYIPHESIMRYEEMLTLIRAVRGMGVNKVRLTGGEPFVRKDFLAFLGLLREEFPDLDLRITTNATLLAGKAAALKLMGVKVLNISLDTLDREKYRRITGRDALPDVLSAVHECLGRGLKVKLNAVAIKGFNDEELPAFLDLVRELPVELRFIEYMPMGGCLEWTEGRLWKAEEILAAASALADLAPLSPDGADRGPSRMFSVAGGRGRVGLISPMSRHFCDSCNRLRVTADGRLRTCLFSDRTFRLLGYLRAAGFSEAGLARIIRRAMATKPLGYKLVEERINGAAARDRAMSAIGG
ncbi:MAG: GTP 3',8-cyclase MoaA [Thermodesulfobacteriota bacterium]